MRKPLIYKSLSFVTGLVILGVGVSACTYYRAVPAPLVSDHYVIEHVTVVDVINQKLLPDRQVEVKAGRIVGLAASPGSTATRNRQPGNAQHMARRIDGRGKYLMPGLWDMHTVLTRLSPELDYPLFIAYGVTSIRSNVTCPNQDRVSLYPCFKQKQRWNQAVESGDLIGPTIRGSGTFPVNGAGHLHPDAPPWHGAGTAQQAEQLVNYYANLPPDERPFFIKNYNWVEPGAYLALVKAARQHRLEVGGHMPRKLGLAAAAEAGQRSFAHARLFMFECSSHAAALRAGDYWDLPLAEQYRLLIDSHDPAICAERYQLLAQNNVYLSPTLLTRRNDYLGLTGELETQPESEYGHYLFASEWREDIASLSQNPVQDAAPFKTFYDAAADTIVKAHQAGVNIMVGTDANDNFVLPGIAMHEEMAELNRAGMSTFDVLTAATFTAAQYFRQSDEAGSINIGKRAGMLLLNANPILDISNSRAIHMVFKERFIYDEALITALKSRAKIRAKSHWPTVKLLFWWAQNPGGF